MKNLTSKLLVVFLGMVAFDGAYAAVNTGIAGKSYVETQIATREAIANKAKTISDTNKASETEYTSVKAVTDYVADQIDGVVSGNVSGKADKVTSATAGNLAGLDATGNITDSGVKASDVATTDALTTGLAGKADKLTTYTKDEVNTELGKKTDVSVTDALTTRVTATEGVANTAATNIGTMTDLDTTATNLVGAINEVRANTAAIDLTPYAKTADVDDALDLKANQATTYTKTEVDTALDKKANTTVTDALAGRVTTAEGNITNLQTGKQDKLTQAANAGTNITIDTDGKISANLDVSGKADAVVVTGTGNGTKVTVNAQGIVTNKGTAGVADIDGLQGALDLKTDKTTTETLAARVTATEGVANTAKTTADTATTNIGTMADLTTTAKNLVGAIEEVKGTAANVSGKADKVTVVVAENANGTKVTVNEQGVVTNVDTAGVADIDGLQDALDLKANQATTYTKDEVNTAVGAKQDKLTGTEGSVVTYGATPGAVGSVALGKLATTPLECSEPSKFCVLTTDGENLVWEVIER
ncbi:hypothetical protein LJC18_03445 [Lachnospiraceae bacterium OttesenSCG-928-E19]|nr:hypothetical protein [Lachnospiraceae bacterium OttesenSCG-928-E19]